MNDDYQQMSRGTQARTQVLSEKTIFWAMVFTAIVAVAMAIKDMVG